MPVRSCQKCDYDLTGIHSTKCPECGAPIDYHAVERHGGTKSMALWIVLGLLAEPVALVLAFASAGAGHGDYAFARLLFPYTMLLSLVTEGRITFPWIALAMIQFPAYGLALGLAASKSRVCLCVTAGSIMALHAASAAITSSGVFPNLP
jgi:hypothetical protein